MIRILWLLLSLTTIVRSYAQRNDLHGNSKKDFNNSIRENFDELGFEWALPQPAQALMHSGLNSLAKGDWKPALNFFNQVIEFDSTFLPAYYFRFSCYEIGKKVSFSNEKTVKDIEYVFKKLSKLNREIYMDLWDVYVPNKTHSRKNNPLLEIAPPFFLLSSYIVDHQGELKAESLDYLKKSASSLLAARPLDALTLNSKAQNIELSTSGLYLRAVTFQLIFQHDSAFYIYNEMLKRDERIIEAHENLALYKHKSNDRNGALKHLISLNSIEPNSPNIWRFSGMLKIQLQDYYGAIVDLTKYMKVDSADFDCLKQRAIAEYEVKDYASSLKDLDRAIKISNHDLDLFLYKSECYLSLGDSSKCIKVLLGARKVFSFDQRLDLFTADKLVEINKTRQAQEIVDRVIGVVLHNNFNKQYLYQANVIQCKIYLRKGNTKKAIEELDAFIKNDGEQFDYLFLRAKIFLLQGEKEKAKADLEKLIRADFKPALTLYQGL